MRVLKFMLLIKIDSFTQFAPGEVQEVSENIGPSRYEYVKRRIQDDRNFWSQEVERTPDRIITTKEAL